jgi:hypothetical protein
MRPGLDAAVADGVIDRATAERLLPYLEANGPLPETADADDEKLRLVTGFNDIFVTIGIALFLGALGYLLWEGGGTLAGLAVAAAAWGLAEFFTRVKRLALPSIALLVIFVGAVFFAVAGLIFGSGTGGFTAGQTLAAGLAAAIAAVLHWLRFHVPITVAAGTAAVVAMLLALFELASPGILKAHPVWAFLPLGLLVFTLAMWFDVSDLKRQTRRTDIAFWLHLLAAPLIVHPILISTVSNAPSLAAAAQVVLAFLLLAAVALIVDRRAILVSSLSYLAYAAGTLIAATGLQSSSLAMATLAVGAIVLLLSAAWRPLRRSFMRIVPASLRQRLP